MNSQDEQSDMLTSTASEFHTYDAYGPAPYDSKNPGRRHSDECNAGYLKSPDESTIERNRKLGYEIGELVLSQRQANVGSGLQGSTPKVIPWPVAAGRMQCQHNKKSQMNKM